MEKEQKSQIDECNGDISKDRPDSSYLTGTITNARVAPPYVP